MIGSYNLYYGSAKGKILVDLNIYSSDHIIRKSYNANLRIDSDLDHPGKPDVFPLNRYMEYIRGILISDTLIQNDHHSHDVSFHEFIYKYSDFPMPEMVF